MKNPTSALTEEVGKQNEQRVVKATQIVIGIDAHLRSYHAARKIDNLAIGAVARFGSQEGLLLYLEKQKQLAQQVVVVYEAGPLGYTLYRALEAAGIGCLVCAPDSAGQKAKRRKNNSIDARTLAGNLFNYLAGNRAALQLVRIPTVQEEQQRAVSRHQQQLVKDRKRLAARGNSLLMAQGYGSWKNWWRAKTFTRLGQLLPQWIKELLESRLDELELLDQKIGKAKLALARAHSGPRPKGAGAVSLVQLQSEVLDWKRYSSARKIGSLSGMVPSEWSTGNTQRLGSITKVGVPAIGRIAIEMAWRIIRFQPEYCPVKKWRHVLQGTNRAFKKKAIVAIARQLVVDLWRLETGRISAAELGLVMVNA